MLQSVEVLSNEYDYLIIMFISWDSQYLEEMFIIKSRLHMIIFGYYVSHRILVEIIMVYLLFNL